MDATHTQTYPKIFKPRQLVLLGLLANPYDRRTLTDKAKAVGVTRRTTFNWRKLPGWQEAEWLLWQWHVQQRRAREKDQAESELERLLMS